MPFDEYLRLGVCEPLDLELDPRGDPGSGMHASLGDVLAVGGELLRPTLVAGETRDEMTQAQFPGLSGVLPEQGRFDPLDWGLGVQLNTEPRSWMGARTSARTYGHFGGSGTFLWVDPQLSRGVVALADREFDEWAMAAWVPFNDALLAELRAEG
jgi:CubicO group peptidase (beta-lactamase class C family)